MDTSRETDLETSIINSRDTSSLQRSSGPEDEKVNLNVEEEGTDEDDGLAKRLRKLACGVSDKKTKDKHDIEPYTRDPQSWTYSKYGTGSGENEQTCSTSQCQDAPRINDGDIYNFTHPQRGYLLLIINEKFYRQVTRRGAPIDLHNMKTIAERLCLRLLNDTREMNLSKSETMNWLQKAQTTDHTDCDCFMFMISTHGLEQRNPGKGGKVDHALVCADDELIFTSTIIEMFNDTNCPTLKGKPKIFFIQACRGNEVDHGGDVKVKVSSNKINGSHKDKNAQFDHAKQQDLDVTDTKAGQDSWANNPIFDTETPCLQCDADMLVMYAVPPGMLAWRNTADGSWMVHYLYEVLMAYNTKVPQNFLHVLTKVAAMMSRRTTAAPEFPELHEKKAVPVIEYKLTKDILFS